MTDDRNIRQLPQQTEKPKRDRIGLVLYIFYTLLLIISALVLVKLVYFQLIWKPEPKIASALTPGIVKRTVEPVRGNIIDCDGRLLAINAEPKAQQALKPFEPSPKKRLMEPRQLMSQEILSAGSTAKMAELTAREIYDLRENRNLLIKGQADFMPKDGA